jgi:dimethylamine corrinoid protein
MEDFLTDIYQDLADAVVRMRADEVRRLSYQILEQNLPPEEAIQQGLAAGMIEVGRLFEKKEYFVPEVLVCARTMYVGFDILKPKVFAGNIRSKGKIVIGVVEGDFHDIGKNIVKLMLEASGFMPIDLGKNADSQKFLQAIAQEEAQLAGLSTLMTTTMESMELTVKAIRSEFPETRIMIGGAPVNRDFADSLNAHFYGENAAQAVIGAHQLLGLKYEG